MKNIACSQGFSHSCLGHYMKVTMSKTPASTFSMPKVQPHFNVRTSSAYQTSIIMQKWVKIIAPAVPETFLFYPSHLWFQSMDHITPDHTHFLSVTHLKVKQFYNNLVDTSLSILLSSTCWCRGTWARSTMAKSNLLIIQTASHSLSAGLWQCYGEPTTTWLATEVWWHPHM